MASYPAGLRKFYPTVLQIVTIDPDSYTDIASFLDNDDTTDANSRQVNNNVTKEVIFTGFSDGAAHTGPFTIYVDHQIVSTSGTWALEMAWSTNDGGSFTTYLDLDAQSGSVAQAFAAQVVNASVPKGDIQLRIRFTPTTAAFSRHNVFEVFAGEAQIAGMMF